ncbi:MAG: hypothetical protein H6815_06065 [Phycisphaeraceae bacterium]|nr:hypothetical protein [Phycisphaerales bacterium]MCB9860003.1 hypothetical protein [Phycisphaeraceae bacterium]
MSDPVLDIVRERMREIRMREGGSIESCRAVVLYAGNVPDAESFESFRRQMREHPRVAHTEDDAVSIMEDIYSFVLVWDEPLGTGIEQHLCTLVEVVDPFDPFVRSFESATNPVRAVITDEMTAKSAPLV